MTKRGTSKLTIETISPYFTQSIQTASKELGICCTLLKKICRKYGITRWPYRKIQSVDKAIQQIKERLALLDAHLAKDASGNVHIEVHKLRRELVELERKKQALLRPHEALINPYNLQPNYRLPFHWVTNSMLPQVDFGTTNHQQGLTRDDFSVSWEFPTVNSSPSTSEQALDRNIDSVLETNIPMRGCPRDDSSTWSKTPMQSGSLEERRDNIHYVPESFPCEDSFSLEYQKSECEPFILSNDESYRITNNDQMSRSSASPTTCGGDGSFEESTLHSFFSNPNNPLDPLPADNSLSSFSSVGWKRCRSDHLFDYASSSSQNMVRRRSASAVLGGSRREDEFLLEPTRRFSLREDEIMRERLLHTESLSREDCIPSSHRSDTIVEWDPRKSGYDIQNTLSGLFQRMDQLEQENSLLRNNLNQLVARIPDPSMKEQLY